MFNYLFFNSDRKNSSLLSTNFFSTKLPVRTEMGWPCIIACGDVAF